MSVPIRQGDVLLIPVASVPQADLARFTRSTPVQRDSRNRLILANGEVTGHAHAILDETATLFAQNDLDEMADRFLRVDAEVALVHDEHDPITLPAGDYIVRRKREHDPLIGLRRVAD